MLGGEVQAFISFDVQDLTKRSEYYMDLERCGFSDSSITSKQGMTYLLMGNTPGRSEEAERGLVLLERAADAGIGGANVALYNIYMGEFGVFQRPILDEIKAIHCLTRAVEAKVDGDAVITKLVVALYYFYQTNDYKPGMTSFPTVTDALFYYSDILKAKGYPEGYSYHAWLHYKQDPDATVEKKQKGYDIYQRAVEMGCADSMVLLELMRLHMYVESSGTYRQIPIIFASCLPFILCLIVLY